MDKAYCFLPPVAMSFHPPRPLSVREIDEPHLNEDDTGQPMANSSGVPVAFKRCEVARSLASVGGSIWLSWQLGKKNRLTVGVLGISVAKSIDHSSGELQHQHEPQVVPIGTSVLSDSSCQRMLIQRLNAVGAVFLIPSKTQDGYCDDSNATKLMVLVPPCRCYSRRIKQVPPLRFR